MPNILVRVTRYLLRNRKRSASLQSSTASSGPTAQDSSANEPAALVAIQGSQVTKEKPLYQEEILSLSSVNEKHETKENDQDAEPKQSMETVAVRSLETAQGFGCEANTKGQRSSKKKTSLMTIKLCSSPAQSTTVRARRVLRELQVMMRASQRPECPFQVSLVDESDMFDWDVRLLKVDETSELWRSMRQTNTESIRFRLTFPELFPFEPPFLRLVGPYLDNGFIMDGGAICMEVLTSQGWSSAYTVESLLVQVASGLTQGGAVVSHKQKRKYNQLSQKRAEAEFRRICKIHAKYGWVNMEREEA